MRIYINIILLFFIQVGISQVRPFKCGTTFTTSMAQYEVQNAIAKAAMTTPPPYDGVTPYVFNLKFWQINDDFANNIIGGQMLSVDNEIMECVKNLNVTFNPHKIYFKYKDFEIKNDSQLTDLNTLAYLNFFTPQSDTNLNIIFVNNLTYDDALTAYTEVAYHCVFIEMDQLLSGPEQLRLLLGHEMGHLFGLWHTNGYYGPAYTPPWECEHVTRDQEDPNHFYNAGESGDYVADTPAEPEIMYWATDFDSNCVYINSQNQVDCDDNPQLYEGIIPYNYLQTGDFLGVPSLSNCAAFHFTSGQVVKMRESILNSPMQFYGGNLLSNARTDIESLFQPFESAYIAGSEVVSVTDLGSGTAEVCYNRLQNNRFQKGFTYSFPENTGSDPQNANVDTIPEVNLHTFDFPVNIAELGPDSLGMARVTCTKGVICVEEAYIGGIIFSTEILGSMNITVKELSLYEAKDPELYQKLLEQYYYILKRETTSGAKTQEVFYKP